MPVPIRKENSRSAAVKRIAFDEFEADLRAGELRKNGKRIRLQAQPFRFLVLLLENPGEVMTREEVCRELWPNDTFVDFEHGLAAAVKKIREAIGDSAENPTYIETLPKRGYRFVGKINPQPPEVLPILSKTEPQEVGATVSGAKLRDRSWRVRTGLFGIATAIVAASATLIFSRHTREPHEAALIAVPFTSFPGFQTAPSFSPDGSRIAFAWDKPKGSSSSGPGFDLYVKAIGSETVLRLTDHPSTWISSTWSPDGTQIAFHRLAPDDNGIYLVPALGGPERKLVATKTPYHVAALISFSPDGKWLAYSDTENGRPGDRIMLLNVDTLEVRKFPHDPSCNHEGSAVFSHSGRDLAFVCVHSLTAFEYFIANLEGTSKHSVATIREFAVGLSWIGGDTGLIISRAMPSGGEIDEIKVSDGSIVPKLALSAAEWPAISRDGHKLAFSLPANHVNIWRRDLQHPQVPPIQLFASTLQQNNARYSPDGKHVLFGSTRSGIWAVWLADSDGSNLVQISHDAAAGFGRWSPDSRKVAFEAHEPDGLVSIYTVDISARIPHKLRTNLKQANWPSWSSDGKWIYLRGYEGVGHQLYRCPAEGGDARLLDAGEDPIAPIESGDGKWLYFPERNLNARLMMLEIGRPGAEPMPVPDMPKIAVVTQWEVMPNGIYFVPQDSPRTVSFYDFATRRTRPVFTTDRELDDGLSVSTDGRYLLYSQADESNSNVMIVNDFK
jgi:Tol biopolymer transport system component/DNA-binding winged helix-turn-helix (wHTH) protein